MARYWGAVEADFRREYGIDRAGLARLGTREFYRLLDHLGTEAVFRHLVHKDPTPVSSPEQVDRALGRRTPPSSSSTPADGPDASR